jgi:hypothetical protein
VLKTAIIAVLLWKKDTALEEDEDCWDGIEDWGACALGINVGVSVEVVTTMGVELGRSVPEGVEDVVRIVEGTEELAAGELVEIGTVVVVVPLLRWPVKRNGFVATHELTV